jgi:hypothetical protein
VSGAPTHPLSGRPTAAAPIVTVPTRGAPTGDGADSVPPVQHPGSDGVNSQAAVPDGARSKAVPAGAVEAAFHCFDTHIVTALAPGHDAAAAEQARAPGPAPLTLAVPIPLFSNLTAVPVARLTAGVTAGPTIDARGPVLNPQPVVAGAGFPPSQALVASGQRLPKGVSTVREDICIRFLFIHTTYPSSLT